MFDFTATLYALAIAIVFAPIVAVIIRIYDNVVQRREEKHRQD